MVVRSFRTIYEQIVKHNRNVCQSSVQNQGIGIWITWLNKIFNSVDKERLKLVGPNLACAEWLLRNGAGVRFKGETEFLTDYNILIELEEAQNSSHYEVEEIFAKEAGLSSGGFDHLKGCNQIQKITLIFCSYINYQCLQKLSYVKDSLKYLEINSCFNVDDQGILSLSEISNLKKLTLANLPSVKNKDECVASLKKSLANCEIEFQN